MEMQIIDIGYAAKLWRQLGFNPQVVEEDSRVDKISLSFELAAAQGGEQTFAALQADSGAEQSYPLAVPVAKSAAGEFGDVHDRVETRRPVVKRLLVARSEKE